MLSDIETADHVPESGTMEADHRVLQQVSDAAKLLQQMSALLPPQAELQRPLEQAQARLLETLVVGFEELCAEIVLDSHAGKRPAGEQPLGVCEAAMARYETEVKPRLPRIVQFVGDHGDLARRLWDASAYCLYFLVVVLPWDDVDARARLLVESIKEHLAPESVMLRRIVSTLGADAGEAKTAVTLQRTAGRRRLAIMSGLFLVALVAFSALLGMRSYSNPQHRLAAYQLQIQQDSRRVSVLQQQVRTLSVKKQALDAEILQARRMIALSENKRRLGIYYDEEAYQDAVRSLEALTPDYNRQVIAYNEAVRTLAGIVEEHNRLAASYNAVNARISTQPPAQVMPLQVLPE